MKPETKGNFIFLLKCFYWCFKNGIKIPELKIYKLDTRNIESQEMIFQLSLLVISNFGRPTQLRAILVMAEDIMKCLITIVH